MAPMTGPGAAAEPFVRDGGWTAASFAREVRLRRLFARGPALIIAWAHAPLLGPGPGFGRESMAPLPDRFVEADGILLSTSHLPAARDLLARRDRPVLFLLHHWQSVTRSAALRGYPEGATAPMLDVEEAARAGADGVMSFLYVGWQDPDREAREVATVMEVSRRCRELGLLHMVESCLVDEETNRDTDELGRMAGYHTRLAAELGADLVKTRWTSAAAMPGIVDACPVPLLLAGGTPKHGFDEAVADVRRAVEMGVAGLVYGRYVFGHPDPQAAVSRLLEALRGSPADQDPAAGG
jgi:DhnA family fructose-bisphosphate aldolase class Ia